MENQIEANNRLIGEFMGMSTSQIDVYLCPTLNEVELIGLGTYVHLDEMIYHNSWSWLMPVVEKIEDIRFDNEDPNSFVSYHRYDIDNRGICCTITDEQEGNVVGYGDWATKRESTYQAVVEFIKYFNKLAIVK